jgi:hypothetical protein
MFPSKLNLFRLSDVAACGEFLNSSAIAEYVVLGFKIRLAASQCR